MVRWFVENSRRRADGWQGFDAHPAS
jgi:hypothetical protein